MIRFIHMDGSNSYRALHSIQVIYQNGGGVLTARTERPDGYWDEVEIKGFELLQPGRIYP